MRGAGGSGQFGEKMCFGRVKPKPNLGAHAEFLVLCDGRDQCRAIRQGSIDHCFRSQPFRQGHMPRQLCRGGFNVGQILRPQAKRCLLSDGKLSAFGRNGDVPKTGLCTWA